MPASDEHLQLLREIRDTQQALLAEHRKASERSVALQEEAVQRQAQIGQLYRRVVVAGAAVGVGILVLVLYLAVRVLRLMP